MANERTNQYAEFLRIMTTGGEREKLVLISNRDFVRYFQSHPEICKEEVPVTDMTIAEWMKRWKGVTGDDFENFEEMVRKKSDSDPRYAAIYERLKNKSKDVESIEYSNDQIASDADKFVKYFRESFKAGGGICPLCGVANLFSTEVCPDKVN